MAKKNTPVQGNPKADSKTTEVASQGSGVASVSPVRNSALPKASTQKKEPSYEQIAARAYEIHISGAGGSQDDDWHQAERELRG